MLAQSLIEYGALDSLSTSASAVASSVRDYVGQLSPTMWVAVGGVAFVVLWLWNRPRRL